MFLVESNHLTAYDLCERSIWIPTLVSIIENESLVPLRDNFKTLAKFVADEFIGCKNFVVFSISYCNLEWKSWEFKFTWRSTWLIIEYQHGINAVGRSITANAYIGSLTECVKDEGKKIVFLMLFFDQGWREKKCL